MKSNHEKLTNHLVTHSNWTTTSVRVGIRAGFKCEYCDRDLFACADSYKTWQEDHIVPHIAGGDPDNIENIALSCRECNVSFKSRWDPRVEVGNHATRAQLIDAVRIYVAARRERTEKEIERYRGLLEKWL